ncbi:hypothetical protein BGX26_003097 [Mortierella sp. AD094]|nr:hypothetical protein BGX26_003097 [Mortierella sp. AD094]
MKGGHPTELIIGDESLEWIEQHHRNTSHKSLLNTSQTQLSFDNGPSGDESDYAELQRQSQFYTADPHKRTKEYHIDQAIQAIQLLKAASKPTGWKKVLKHKSGCLVYQSTNNGDKHPAFKGEHVIRGYRAQDVFSVVGVRKLWDDWYDELSMVESYDDATNLMYMVMKSTLSSKTRDISMVERIEVERDGTIYFASCSVESSKIPRISGKVRADIFVAGWIIQPLPSNPPITKITYVIQTDLLSRLPKFIARRALAKRPLVITTIETHLKKNGVPMVMSNLVSQNTNRHRSLSEPLKPEKFLFAEPEQEEKVQSGSAFLSPIRPIKDIEQLNDDKDEFGDDDIQLNMNESTTARNSLAPSLMSNKSIAPSIFTSEFLENNALLGDTALFGDSQLFGKGGIYDNRNQDQMSIASNDESQSHSQLQTHARDRSQLPPPPLGARTTPTGLDTRRQQSAYKKSVQTSSDNSDPASNPTPRNLMQSTTANSGPPHVVTPATPPLTPTTSVDGKDATSDSDASSTPKVRVVPRIPKQHVPTDPSLPARPSSMMFAAYGMRSPSDIMESRRHSAMIGRSSSFAPRHSRIIPLRGSSSLNFQGLSNLSKTSGPTSPLSNATKRHSTAPSIDSNRSLTLLPPALALPHRHSETARKALAMFKVLASSPEDRWRAVSSDGAFKSYSRVISGAGLPMLRGEGVITGGWTVEQINAVIESSGCRQIWDERFENMSIAETFNANEYLFHVSLQGIASLTGRDLAGVTIIDRDPNTSALYNVSTSVLDSTIPEDPGRIRALLELSGWSLRPIFDGHGNTLSVNVTFVIQIDIRGTLPNSVVKSLTASMMTAVPRLNHFINKTGYPPYASQISGTRLLDTFDPKTGYYELCYKTAPGWTEVRVGRKVYKEGYDFFIKPDDPTVRVELAPDFGGVRIWTTLDHEGQSITAQVSRKGQHHVKPSQQKFLQLQQEDDDDEIDRSGRRSRDSFVPQRPRDSRVFESSSPTYGGPSPRKSSSLLKSNEHIQNAEQVESGSPVDVGSGSDLRPQRTQSSVSRKRRSASFTTLSSFDPNLVVASSSDRPAETPQTSMMPKASEESKRSRSRSRTPRSLANVPILGTPPPPPRRSSSLGRHSIPITTYFQGNAPPVPIKSSITSPTFGTPPALAPTAPIIPSTPTILTNVSAPATVCSPLSSPTLGPFHIPQLPEPIASLDEDLPFSDAPLSKNSILQPAAEIPSCPVSSSSEADNLAPFSTSAAISSSPDIVMVSLNDIENGSPSDFSLVDPESEPEQRKGSLSESTEMSVRDSNEEEVMSLAIMDSPQSSPRPKTALTRRKDSGSRRVTFSPDVVDNPENRPSLHRVKKSSRKRSSSSASINPPSELQDLKVDGIKCEEENLEIKEIAESKAVVIDEAISEAAKANVAIVQDEHEYESDEAEFVEASTELSVANQKEQIEEEKEKEVVVIAAEITVVEKRKSSMMLMEMDHLQNNEEVWQMAIESFIEELKSMQTKLAVAFVLLMVIGSGLSTPFLRILA